MSDKIAFVTVKSGPTTFVDVSLNIHVTDGSGMPFALQFKVTELPPNIVCKVTFGINDQNCALLKNTWFPLEDTITGALTTTLTGTVDVALSRTVDTVHLKPNMLIFTKC